MQSIYNYLFNKGWTKESICGLLGNIQQESQLNPGVWQDQDNTKLGYGLVQWDDATKFLNWANLRVNDTNSMANNNSTQLMNLQLDFLIWSSETSTSSSVRKWFPTTGYGSPYYFTVLTKGLLMMPLVSRIELIMLKSGIHTLVSDT